MAIGSIMAPCPGGTGEWKDASMHDESVSPPSSPARLRQRRAALQRIASACGAVVWPAATGLLAAAPAQAQTAAPGAWPRKAIQVVSPFTAGSGTDIVARLIAERLAVELGVPVVVEPRPGAAGNIGAGHAAQQAPDGHTLMVTSASFAIAPALYRNLNFDPIKHFTPVTKIATAPLLVLVPAESPLKTMADLVAMARKDPQAVSYGSFGNGSPSHLMGESIASLAGISMTHVPYSNGRASVDLLGGRLTLAILDALSQTPQVKAGKLRALALNGTQRLPSLPDVPTLVEQGIAFDTVGWQAMFVPAGVPAEIVDRLNRSVNRILAVPEVQRRINDVGCFPVLPPTTPQQWGEQFRRDVQTWAEMVRRSGAKID